jgi:Tfp pilus assembly protein PilF
MKIHTVLVSLLLLLAAVILPPARAGDDTELQRWSAAVDKDPKDATAYLHRGDAYMTNQDYEHAIEDYTKAIKLNPEDADVYVRRVVAGIAWQYEYQEKGMGGDSDATWPYINRWEDLNKALKIDPKNTRALTVRGEQYLVIVQYDKALADFTAAIRIDPKDADAYRLRAELYANKADREYQQDQQAVQKEDMAKAIADYSAEIRIRLAGAADKKKFALEQAAAATEPGEPQINSQMRVAYWGAVLELDPKNANAWYQRAQAVEQCMGERAAKGDYDKANALDPKNTEGREKQRTSE